MMQSTYERRLLPILIRMDAERSHRLALRGLQLAERLPGGISTLTRSVPEPDPRLTMKCFGLEFSNPLGVAAGLDKDAEVIDALFALGFGAVETGTVTPRAQPGNPRPRVWRIPEERAVINAMGFPSHGVTTMKQRLFGKKFPGVLGINLGKNKETPLERAAIDYVHVLDELWQFADYITINVSSPNTPGLRELQGRDALARLVKQVQRTNRWKADVFSKPALPVLVKIAPDLNDAELDQVLAGALDGEVTGLIVSNTTTDHSVFRNKQPNLPGGISGEPLRAKANTLVGETVKRLGETDRLPIIGVGGISSADDVVERMRSGASLVQIYTSFVYGGPGLPGRILQGLSDYCEHEGLTSIGEIVGADAG